MSRRKGILPSGEPGSALGLIMRPRLNALLKIAVLKPLVIVCAGAGYGKTRAVYDFTQTSKVSAIWIQLSNNDNVASRFWENYVRAFGQLHKPYVDNLKPYIDDLKDIGFPDTEEKFGRYRNARDSYMADLPYSRLLILDDFHLIHNPEIISFIKRIIQGLPSNRCVILITRDFSQINIAGQQSRNNVFIIQEEDLNFTENEISQYLSEQGLSVTPQALREIKQDTNGWAFSVNLVARAMKKAPSYSGYIRNAMRLNVYRLMEDEVWEPASGALKHFLVQLSLIERLSADLIESLAGGNENLLTEFKYQTAFTRYDAHMDAYLIHHLFLDFLRAKQDILTAEEKHTVYHATADWCAQNDFLLDALVYYEKDQDYESIVSVCFRFFMYMKHDFALRAAEIFGRAPSETFLRVDFFAAMHARVVMNLGRWQELRLLMEYYEKELKKIPEDNAMRNHTLGVIYYIWGAMRYYMSTSDDRYDFNDYYTKMDACLTRSPLEPNQVYSITLGPWISNVGCPGRGSMEEFTKALIEVAGHMDHCLYHAFAGIDILCRGELELYRGNIPTAEPLIIEAMEHARKYGQFEIVHRAMLYIIRIAILRGDRAKAEKMLKDMESLLSEREYTTRYIIYDIARGWYGYILRQPSMIPNWLKEDFSIYIHSYTIENFENQMKAHYFYLIKNYSPLLAYIEQMKQRESVLYGNIEMLAMEACIWNQLRDKTKAFAALREAYEASSPNDIVLPFIELGKDMRTLTNAALRDEKCNIPKKWLEVVNKRAALYGKYQAAIISEYELNSGVNKSILLSTRETAVLRDLCAGLSRAEIAAKQVLSLSTVNMNVQSICTKLQTKNVAEIIRIAVEQKLV